MKKAVLLIIIALLPVRLPGADYIIEINPDKTIIHLAELGYPDNTPVSEVLRMMPELVSRGGDVLFPNYTIQYDGKSVGEARDVILQQIIVRDLDKIEISESSVSTQTKNGQSGTINIVPKKYTKDGFGGDVNLPLAFYDVMPGVNLDFKKNKLQIGAQANIEYYYPTGGSSFKEETPGVVKTGTESEKEKYFQQTARVNLKYQFTDKDLLKMWVLESYSNGRNTVDREYSILTDKSDVYGPGWKFEELKRDTVFSSSKTFLYNTMAEYSHNFTPTNKVVAFAGFETSRSDSRNTLNHPNDVDAELKYEGVILNAGEHRLKLKTGANMSFSEARTDKWDSRRLYLSPYADLEYIFRGLDIKAALRYQNNGRRVNGTGSTTLSVREEDFVANVNTFLQICPHHALRLILNRNLVRPQDNQMLPGLTFDDNVWTMGNPELGRSYVHTCELTYITDIHKDEHTFVFTPKIGYIRADNVIVPVLGTTVIDGREVSYTSYENSGSNDITKFSLQGMYKHNIFTLSLGGNLFINHVHNVGGTEKNRYFNIVANPVFDFNDGWHLSGNLTYNSPVERGESVLGGRLFAEISLSKEVGNWTFGAILNDIFDTLTTDYTIKGDTKISKTYDLYGRYLGVAVKYRFGKRLY